MNDNEPGLEDVLLVLLITFAIILALVGGCVFTTLLIGLFI